MRLVLLLLALVAAVVSLLNWVRAPDTRLAWMTALAVGEFGHWFVLFPLGLGLLAAMTLPGGWRVAVWVLALIATVNLFRPAFVAWRMGGGKFSWVRLYWRSPEPDVETRREIYARPGGPDLAVDLCLPPSRGTNATKRPGLLVIHGGGWDSGDSTQLAAWNRRWAARGWVVAAINYRLAPANRWPAQGEDAAAALAWLKAHATELGLDANRLVVFGRSAGGQIASAATYGAHDPAIRGLITLYAPHDMQFAWSVSREDDALNSFKLLRQLFGGPPDTPERRALYDAASGQLLARADSPPTLLIHGGRDNLVSPVQSERLAERLAVAGCQYFYLNLPWATHGCDVNFSGPSGQISTYTIERFLATVV